MSSPGNVPSTAKGPTTPRHRLIRRCATVLLVLALVVVLVTWFGGYLLVAPDPLPPHADAVVVLGGTDEVMMARFGEGVRLLQQGRVDHLMLMVGAISRWGEWMPDVVRSYIASELPEETARAIVVCEGLADSTVEEAGVLLRCLRGTGWKSLVIVTSNFHTRRAKLVWHAVLARDNTGMNATVHGVADGSFEARGWWRKRLYAKTWVLETTKLGWYLVESIYPGRWCDEC